MRRLELATASGTCRLWLGAPIDRLAELSAGRRTALVTDHNVARHHAARFPAVPVTAVAPGEATKTLATVRRLYERFLELEIDRHSLVLGVGGGVVCDLTAFAAATFMRGLAVGLVPSTVLAQVDAAIGGKNGVNLDGYKNLVGTIVQPEFVLADPALLATLPARELRAGLAEVIKAAAIGDGELFELLEQRPGELLRPGSATLEQALERAAAVKVALVGRDEREAGERRLLNFGHTLGHALERCVGVGHGEAVAAGMAFAARLAVQRGLLDPASADRLVRLIERVGLPTRIPADPVRALDAMRRDKKRRDESIDFVLLTALGAGCVSPIPFAELAEALDDLR